MGVGGSGEIIYSSRLLRFVKKYLATLVMTAINTNTANIFCSVIYTLKEFFELLKELNIKSDFSIFIIQMYLVQISKIYFLRLIEEYIISP